MTNRDQEIIDWILLAKGDIAGHVFHGNQWTHLPQQIEFMKHYAPIVATAMFHRSQKNQTIIGKSISNIAMLTGGERVKPQFAIKSPDSLVSKLIRDAKEMLGNDAKDKIDTAAEQMGDAVRYTIKYPTEKFTDGVKQALDALQKAGYEPVKVKNFYNNDPENAYRGINSVFRDPVTNQKFEVQFHTPESYSQIEPCHKMYEANRELDKDTPEWQQGQADMIARWQTVPIPAGVESIGKVSVKKADGSETEVLYFYDYQHPEEGVVGQASLSDGKFVYTNGIAGEMIANRRELYNSLLNENPSDEEIFDDLNGWTNTIYFATDKPTSWSFGG